MVQVIYTKDQGLKQQSGSASFSIESGIPLSGHVASTTKKNTFSILDLDDAKHAAAPAGDNEIDFSNKYILLANHKGEKFYLWFSIGGAGVDPAITGATSIAIIEAAGQLDTLAKVQDAIVARINHANNGNGVDYSDPANRDTEVAAANFVAAEDGANVKVTMRAMGADASAVITSVSQFENLTDGNDGALSMTVSSTPGEGSYLLPAGGISNVSNALLGTSFVVLKDLTSDDHYGARKIVVRPANGEDFKLNDESGNEIHDFGDENDIAHLVWNGSAWKTLYSV